MTKNQMLDDNRKPIRTLIAAAIALITLGSAVQADRASGDFRTYIFGHSLINNNSGPSAIPYWLTLLARSDKKRFNYAGQWGFMEQHSENLPPVAHWQFDGAPSFWNHDLQSFDAANFNSILLTPANFIQWQAPTIVVDGARNSPVGYTLEVIDWVTSQEPGVDIYIYENWPDMSGFLANKQFPPTSGEFAKYNEYTLGAFSDWWAEYQEALSDARPNLTIESIPVGPTIAKMLTETSLLSEIPVTDLYYDDAPHGTPTLYFLASLVTYAGMYQSPPPENFAVPPSISRTVRDNYKDIVRWIAAELRVS